MELPLNSEICEPADGSNVELGGAKSIRVRGYALGSHGKSAHSSQSNSELTLCALSGTPIQSVNIALIPLPLPSTPSQPDTSAASPGTDLPHPEQHQIRLFANSLSSNQWTQARLEDHLSHGEGGGSLEKNWGWTLFSASVEIPKELSERTGERETKVALVAYAGESEPS